MNLCGNGIVCAIWSNFKLLHRISRQEQSLSQRRDHKPSVKENVAKLCFEPFMLQHEIDRNQNLLGRIKKLEEKETEAAKNLSEQMEANRALCRNLESLNKKLDEREIRLNTANQVHTHRFTHTCCVCTLIMSLVLCWLTSVFCSQTISSLKDEIRELKQKIQNKDSTISTQTLENQGVQEQLDLQRR